MRKFRKILLIGAGKSSGVLINYLLTNQTIITTVADSNIELAKSKVGNALNGDIVKLDIFDDLRREELIKDKDIVISLLPANLHHIPAATCIKYRVPFITASYVSSEIVKLSKSAEETGVPIIMEMGLDPGLDHMSAKREIDSIESHGGVVVAFKSFCGGLLAPNSIDNPWAYKFSWNPRNVVLAGQGTAKYLQEGITKFIPYHKLFSRTEIIDVDGEKYEAYYNRDSLTYLNSYTKEIPKTFIRGTLRYPGFSEAWDRLIQLGMTDDSYIIENTKGITYYDFLKMFTPNDYVFEYLNISYGDDIHNKMKFIGLFSNETIEMENGTPAQILQEILEKKWKLQPLDKDMIVMKHEFEYLDSKKELHKLDSTLVCVGNNSEETAMAKTVGLPLGIAAIKIIDGEIKLKGGIHIPTIKELYEPILNELVKHDIIFKVS